MFRWLLWVGCGALLGAPSGLSAQPLASPGGPAQGIYRAEISYTGPGADKVEATLVQASYRHSFRLGEGLTGALGPVYSGLWLGTDPGLPQDLHGAALSLSAQWVPADRWWVQVDVRPGLYSDWADLSGEDINAPALVAVGYEIRTNLVLVAGININFWSRLATVGGPGVTWQIDRAWRLNLVLPKPVLEFTPRRDWSCYAGGEIRGGSYRLGENFGTAQGRAEFNGDKFAYRELRVLGGVRWSPNRSFRLAVEGGYAADREFEFREADWEFRVDGAPYIQVLTSGSF